jgi:hypothetical protein
MEGSNSTLSCSPPQLALNAATPTPVASFPGAPNRGEDPRTSQSSKQEGRPGASRDRNGRLEACLAEVTHSDLSDDVGLRKKALRAQRNGHPEAAHALTASVLSGLVHEEFGFERFSQARERWTSDDPSEVELSVARLAALLQVFGRALHQTDHATGPGFNRHATAHGHPTHYTQANAIAAHMLLVGLLRELDFWFKREDEEREERDAA